MRMARPLTLPSPSAAVALIIASLLVTQKAGAALVGLTPAAELPPLSKSRGSHELRKERDSGPTRTFSVGFERLLQSPILSEAFSSSTFNYNAAYVPHVGTDSHDDLPRDCLAVRVQNYTSSFESSAEPSFYNKKARRAGGSTPHSLSYSSLLAAQRRQQRSSGLENVGVGYVGPSSIAIVCEDSYLYPFAKEGTWTVLEPSQADYQNMATEDPRVVYLPFALETDEYKKRRGLPGGKEDAGRNSNSQQKQGEAGTLLMFYTAVNNLTSDGHVTAQLALAVCHLAVDPQCRSWELRGRILPDREWSKSGALMVAPPTSLRSTASASGAAAAPQTHYLLFGDTEIFVATTTDFLTYTDLQTTLLPTRDGGKGYFDSNLVESGPPPELLSDGESYIFLYNSAKEANIPNPDPNWKLQYNLGYAILALPSSNTASTATDVPLPLVLQRAESPLLSPELGWETCNNASKVPGLTADVVFVEGMKRLRGTSDKTKKETKVGSTSTFRDTFLVYYQGADARMGMGLLTVDTTVIV